MRLRSRVEIWARRREWRADCLTVGAVRGYMAFASEDKRPTRLFRLWEQWVLLRILGLELAAWCAREIVGDLVR